MPNKSSTSFAVILFATCWASVAVAAPEGPPTPSGRFDDPIRNIEFAIDISDEESKAEINVGGYFIPPPKFSASDDPNASEPIVHRNDYTWKAGIALPVGGTDDILDDATLDALADGLKVSGSFNILSYSFDPNVLSNPGFLALMKRARAACSLQAKTEADKIYCKDALPAENFVRTYLPSATLEMNRILFRGYTSISLKASMGVNDFKFVTPLTLAENKDTKTSFSVGVAAVYYPSDAVSAWKIETEYANAYEAVDETILCKPLVVNPASDCTKAAPAGPDNKESLVIRGEYRRFFPFRTGKGGIGVALTSSIDTLSDDVGIELPVFLSLPGDAPVAPGIKLGYTTEKKDFTISLFLKSAFKF